MCVLRLTAAVQLVDVAIKRLGSLSKRPKLTRENFAKYEATFLARRQTFLRFHYYYVGVSHGSSHLGMSHGSLFAGQESEIMSD